MGILRGHLHRPLTAKDRADDDPSRLDSEAEIRVLCLCLRIAREYLVTRHISKLNISQGIFENAYRNRVTGSR